MGTVFRYEVSMFVMEMLRMLRMLRKLSELSEPNETLAMEVDCVTIHVTISHFRFVPTLLPLHETIMSLGSNLGTHCHPRWDPCTIRAQSPFPIPPHIYTTLLVYTFPHSEY